MAIFKSQWLAIVVFIMVRITPSITVQQIAPMANSLIVIKLKLVFLYCSSEHYTHQYPRTNIKPCQFYKYFSFGLSNLNKSRPIHLLISSFDYSIANSKEMFARIRSQYIFRFDFSCFKYSFLGLLIIFIRHDF